jgi:fatty acid desaturase
MEDAVARMDTVELTRDSDSLCVAAVSTFEATISDVERKCIRAAVSTLSVLSPARSIAALAFDWLVIGAAIGLGIWAETLIATTVCLFVIGSRQHALLLLMHDAAHRRLHPNPIVNEWVSDVFCALPLFVTTASYRASHFAHHRHTNTGLDPDWVRRQGDVEWRFPKSRVELTILLLKQVGGLNAAGMIAKALRFGRAKSSGPPSASAYASRTLVRVVFYTGVAATLTYFGAWTQFLLFWVLPVVTSLALLMRIRSIAEHFGLSYADELSSSRNVMPTAAERLFLGLHSSHLHLDHHLYPSVPFYHLGRLHAKLLEIDVYRQSAKTNTSYLFGRGPSLWNDLVAQRITG